MPRFGYGLAILGPLSVASVQFVLGYLLLHVLDAFSFGTFSFYLLLIQFTLGISSAMFCAPMSHDIGENQGFSALVYKASVLLFSGLTSALVAVALYLSVGSLTATIVGLYTFFAHLRWFARAYAYVHLDAVKSFVSDLCFSATLAATGFSLSFTGHLTLDGAFGCYALAAILSLLPFNPAAFLTDARLISVRHVRGYGRIWKRYAQHALLGVITTEATSNIHAYMITLLQGASSFAPIAAASMMIRPITLCANAITDIERPRVAREVAKFSLGNISRSLTIFRSVLVAGWIITGGILYALAWLKPHLLFGNYEFSTMIHASTVWLTIALFRYLARPESVLLQAAGEFKELANANVIGGMVSVLSCGMLLASYGTTASLYGILMGDVVAAMITWSSCKTWLRNFAATRSA